MAGLSHRLAAVWFADVVVALAEEGGRESSECGDSDGSKLRR